MIRDKSRVSAEFIRKSALIGALAFVLSACATAENPSAELIPDPFEPVNRVTHQVNKGLDRVALRPASKVYAKVPSGVRTAFRNLGTTWALPSDSLNALLQGDVDAALKNFAGFALNVSLGLGGFVDLAGEAGVETDETDFGETLAVWGVEEGPFVEMPIFGPRSSRDAVGVVVDLFTNPLGLGTVGAQDLATTTTVTSALDLRDSLGETLDAAYYDSPDSYESLKTLAIQQRRGQLNSETAPEEEDYVDPFAEF